MANLGKIKIKAKQEVVNLTYFIDESPRKALVAGMTSSAPSSAAFDLHKWIQISIYAHQHAKLLANFSDMFQSNNQM